MLNVLAGEAGGRKFIPVYQSLYSPDAPQYVSENDEIFTAVDTIRARSGDLVSWSSTHPRSAADTSGPLFEISGKFERRMD
jgi:hypothetical protein